MNFQAVPKPVLSVFPLSFLVASSDLGPNDLENEFLMNSLHLSQVCTCHFLTPYLCIFRHLNLLLFVQTSQIQMKIEEAGRIGVDATKLDDEAFNIEAALDRCILRLIANCCNGGNFVLIFNFSNLELELLSNIVVFVGNQLYNDLHLTQNVI